MTNDKYKEDRKDKDQDLKTNANSPIPAEAREDFLGLNYFDPDSSFRFELELIEFLEKEEIIVKDSKGNDRHFIRFGKFVFNINEIENELVAYKSDPSDPRLFIPFKDKTTAVDTYGAGRYLDIHEDVDQIDGKWILDFNLAYNPWCAYNYNYSCPLVPDENVLDVAITVGEKKLK